MAIDPATVTIILTCALLVERVFNYSLSRIKTSKCCGAQIETRDPVKNETELKNELPEQLREIEKNIIKI
jgi:hypothetical protein